MGNSALQCASDQARAPRVVYPDGHVESLAKSCTVFELLQKHSNHFVCNTSPLILKNRMQPDAKLDPGQTYFLCVIPRAHRSVPASSERRIEIPDRRTTSTISFESSKGENPRTSTPEIVPSRPGAVCRQRRNSVALGSSHSSRRVFDSNATTMWIASPTVEQKTLAKRRLTQLVFFRPCVSVVHLGLSNFSSKANIKLFSSPRRPLNPLNVECKILNSSNPSKSSYISIPAVRSNVQLESCGKLFNSSYTSNAGARSRCKTRPRSQSSWKPMLQSISEVMVTVDPDDMMVTVDSDDVMMTVDSEDANSETLPHSRNISTSDANLFSYSADPKRRLVPSKLSSSSLLYIAWVQPLCKINTESLSLVSHTQQGILGAGATEILNPSSFRLRKLEDLTSKFTNHCNWKLRQFASPTSQARSGTCSVYSSESMSMGLSSTEASEFPLPTWITISKWL